MILQTKGIRAFVTSAGVILAITGVAKVASGFGGSLVLEYPEPISGTPIRYVFWILGAFELCIASVCFLGKRLLPKVQLLTWLSTNFLVYRLGLNWLGHKPCSCLGNATEALHIPAQLADTGMVIVLGYLILGSYSSLFVIHRQHNRRVEEVVVAAKH